MTDESELTIEECEQLLEQVAELIEEFNQKATDSDRLQIDIETTDVSSDEIEELVQKYTNKNKSNKQSVLVESTAEPKSWQRAEIDYGSINLKDGIVRMTDSIDENTIRVQPSSAGFNFDRDDKPGRVTFSTGRDDHGFRFSIDRIYFEAIMHYCCQEWGYKVVKQDDN